MIPSVSPRGRAMVARAAAAADPDPDAVAALAAKQRAFDADAADQAEIDRELAALESIQIAELKNEDAALKEWIRMI